MNEQSKATEAVSPSGDSQAVRGAAQDAGEDVQRPIFTSYQVRRSNSIGDLVGALAKAQLGYKPIVKGVENTFYTTDRKKAMYADLAAVIAATQKALAENGVVIIQSPLIKPETKEAGVLSLMAHSSGQWIEVEALLPATAKVKEYKEGVSGFTWGVKFDAQTCGIAITYSRRYTYQSQTGVAAEEDDDGNSIGEAASGSKEAAQAVGAAKVASMKEKTAQKGQPSSQEARSEAQKAQTDGETRVLGGILREYKSLATSKGQKFFAVVVDAEEVRIWGNPKFGEPGTTFDQLLAFGHGRFCQFVVQTETKNDKTYTMIRGIREIAGRKWDDEGLEIISREAGE